MRLTELLRDADLHWAGTDIGLQPVMKPEVWEQLSTLSARYLPELVKTLSSESEFVAAHVVLTSLSGVEYEGSPTWNGLSVEIEADGRVHIDPRQRFELARRWNRWVAASPKPKHLPSAD